ncbi:MAG TPA: sialidase family protein, partial [Tepidisphaeraceae bacterium]|nr:sialidase family protein [Tepidisphaeraceae bacterium]
VTDGKAEYYRPAVAVDGQGKVWVFYSAHLNTNATLDQGDWELMACRMDADGKTPEPPVNISNAPGTDFMPAACTDSTGRVAVAWVGARDTNFDVFVAQQDGDHFTAPARVSRATGNEWEPAIAADAKGNLAVAWDTYEKGDYDIFLSARDSSGKWSPPQVVAGSPGFEVRASLAYDPAGRLWVAYEGSGDLWGKDFGALKKKGIPIYGGGRYLAVKVLGTDGAWQTPPDVMAAVPPPNRPAAARAKANPKAGILEQTRNQIAPCFPRLAIDPKGGVYLTFRGRTGQNWRVGVGSVWCEYVTHLSGEAWSTAAYIPRSNDVLDNRPALVASNDGLLAFFAGDGRGEMNPPKHGDPDEKALLNPPANALEAEALASLIDQTIADTAANDSGILVNAAPVPVAADEPAQPKRNAQRRNGGGGARRGAGQPDPNQDIFVAFVKSADLPAGDGAIKLTPAAAEQRAPVAQDTLDERKAIEAMRSYRINLNGEPLRVWRGEFHRHTEFSPDGGGDGGLLDLWRYAIDAVGNDWIGDGDHDYGNGREYSWWTTQKCVTLFTLPGHFTPVFSYERSVVYPEGHRNCMFAQRGVRSLPRMPLSSPDKFAPAPDTDLLYIYLHHFKGLCASHTSATNMGTDWRNNDPMVEPLVEIYQGDRNNYERPDAPRSAVTEAKLKQSTPEKESLGGWQPKGFVNLALQKGYRLAFESSSDHISTHLSFTNVLVSGEPTREAILDAIHKRRVYGATANIIADVRCKAGDHEHLMGEEFTTNEPPTLKVNLIGTQKFVRVVIIKDDVVVHEITPNTQQVTFDWKDPNPIAGKTSYYYVRGEQAPDFEGVSSGELVWASPMWIKYDGK